MKVAALSPIKGERTKELKRFGVVSFLGVAVGVLALALASIAPLSGDAAATSSHRSEVSDVWTEPQMGYGFLVNAIQHARHSIDMSMYELSDGSIERELIAKAHSGVTVRVLLDAAYYGTSDNAPAVALLRASSVHVEWAPSSQIFHAKYLVIDKSSAFVGTGNLDSSDYSSTRDFWVEDRLASDVRAIESTFSDDFARKGIPPRSSGGLVWSPGSTSTLVDLIASARRTLLVENEEMDSPSIEQALVTAAKRGVLVKVVMTYDSSSKAALVQLEGAGVHVHVLNSSQLYIHAKAICVDCEVSSGTVFIGSENFSTSSLSYNRELGVVTDTPKAVDAVMDAVNSDYAVGSPMT
jgi:phosphatidylserine/phosphatidylglycerophosphate/cardiolipin synthase-like enzyme